MQWILAVILLVGSISCATPDSLNRDSSVSASLIINAPIDIVYQEAINAAIETQLLIASESYTEKEIRLNSGSYMTGIFLCSGNLIGVFLSEVQPDQTKVELVEQLVLATQVLGCHDKAPAYMSRLHTRVRQLAPPKAEHGISTGTGFFVSPDGLILTAYHIIKNAKTIKINLPNGSVVEATIDKIDPANDLATLKINKENQEFLSLAPLRSVQVGERVFTFGFPVPSLLGQEPKYTEGVISSLSGLKGASSILQTTIPVQPGNSGGPVVNESGEVVGVVTSTAAIKFFLEVTGTIPQNINWAIKADYARLLFDVKTGRFMSLARSAILDKVKKSIILIEAIPSRF